MAVNTRAFIIPSFILGSIHADNQHIFPTEMYIIGDIVGDTAIAAGIVAEIISIDPYFAVPVNPVKLDDSNADRNPQCEIIKCFRYQPILFCG